MAEQRSTRAPNRMREIRAAQGVSQVRLAELTGYTQAEISRWERSVYAMSATSAVIVARALGVTVEDLIDVPPRSGAA